MNHPTPSLQLQVNGESRAFPAGIGLSELVVSLGLSPQTALVEHNGRALLRDEWIGLELADGDQLEILRVVAGG